MTAYAYAVAGGYTGTEEEFTELVGGAADAVKTLENASYIDGAHVENGLLYLTSHDEVVAGPLGPFSGIIDGVTYLTYLNYDGTVLKKRLCIEGVPQGYYSDVPYRPETDEYAYEFIGWAENPDSSTNDSTVEYDVTEDRVVYAIYVPKKKWRVSFYNGDVLIGTASVADGRTAFYNGPPPTKLGVENPDEYMFKGWYPDTNNVFEDKEFYACYDGVISDTWEQIIESIESGTYKGKYSVFEKKPLDLGTEGIVDMQIVAFDRDDLANGPGKVPITWISKHVLNTDHRMDLSTRPTNWNTCEMRTYLKETVKQMIPSYVRSAIKEVKKYTRIYNDSRYVVNNYESTEDVWIPSSSEIALSRVETIGVSYKEVFLYSYTERVKRPPDNGDAKYWWLRTSNSSSKYNMIGPGGSSYSNTLSGTYGVVLGFCT